MARTANRKAILLDDVEHLGHRGEIVAVSRGYLRNYLVPRKLAEEATPARVREVEGLAATRAAQEARTAEQAHDIAALLTKTVLTIPARTGPDGRLYGSVTAADLADEIWRTRKCARHCIPRRRLPSPKQWLSKKLSTPPLTLTRWPRRTSSEAAGCRPRQKGRISRPKTSTLRRLSSAR